jgi:hypothetical protein
MLQIAVLWIMFLYIKDVQQLLKTRQVFREVIFNLSTAEGISLATPLTHVVNNETSVKPNVSFN